MASRNAPSTFTPQVVATIAGLAAAGAIVYLCKTALTTPSISSQNHLHRSNALRRPHRHAAETAGEHTNTFQLDGTTATETDEFGLTPDQHRQIDSIAAQEATATGRPYDRVRQRIFTQWMYHVREAQQEQQENEDAVTENDMPDLDAAQVNAGGESQDLQELLFAISKARAKNEGVFHSNIWCDRCQKIPIVGVRYKCANCEDFDLCEECEAQDDHTRTHIFYKIRVPMPWSTFMSPRKLWYPGRPRMLPREIPSEVHDYISQQVDTMGLRMDSSREKAFDGLHGRYAQFTCLANQPLPDDPCHLGYAIDTEAFATLVPPCSDITSEGASLIAARLFAFFDKNQDGYVSFDEFFIGRLLIHDKDSEERRRRIFRCFDLNDDGEITRQELLRLFRALHELNQDTILSQLGVKSVTEDNAEYGSPHEYIDGSRSLAAFWARSRAVFHENTRAREGKVTDDSGEVNMEAPHNFDGSSNILVENTNDIISRKEAIGGNYGPIQAELQEAFVCAIQGKGHLDFGLYRTDLPQDGPSLQVIDEVVYVKHGIHMNTAKHCNIWIATDLRHDSPAGMRMLGEYGTSSPSGSGSQVDLQLVRKQALIRCLLKLEESRDDLADDRLISRSQSKSYHLPDEENDLRNRASNKTDGEINNRFSSYSNAAQSIYNVTQEALNNMLNPFFRTLEFKLNFSSRQRDAASKYTKEMELVQNIYSSVTGLPPADIARLKAETSSPDKFKRQYKKMLRRLRVSVLRRRLAGHDLRDIWDDMSFDKPGFVYKVIHATDDDGPAARYDPTFPQFRRVDPSTGAADIPQLYEDRFFEVVFDWLDKMRESEEWVKDYFKTHKNWGAINEREWMELFERKDEAGEPLLAWAQDWFNLIRI